jgi:hypothetical protein
MLRATKDQKGWEWLPWLVVLSFSGIGITVLVMMSKIREAIILIGLPIWFNLLLQGTTVCRYLDKKFPAWGWQRLIQPVLVISVFALFGSLLISGMTTLFGLFETSVSKILDPAMFLVLAELAILVNLSWLHVMMLQPSVVATHIFLLSLANTVLFLVNPWLPAAPLIWYPFPLLLALWTLGLLVIQKTIITKITTSPEVPSAGLPTVSWWMPGDLLSVLRRVLHAWSVVSFGVALLSLLILIYYQSAITMANLVVLALLSGISFAHPYCTSSSSQEAFTTSTKSWLASGMSLLLGLLFLVWLIWLPRHLPRYVLLPWYAFQSAGLTWLCLWLQKSSSKMSLSWLLSWTTPLLAGLLVVTWVIHLFLFGGDILTADFSLVYLFGVFDQVVVILTGFLLMGLWWRSSGGEQRIYGIILLLTLISSYTRLFLRGAVAVDLWDTAGLMVASYVLLGMQHLFHAASLHRLTLLIPLSALLTMPMQLNSIHTSGTLLATAALYLLMQRRSGQSVSVYLGLLAMNAGIYLWIPDLASHYKLLWIYTVPMSITVLMMLQLHWLELKQNVIHATRLAALSTLYVSATLDVFLRPEGSVFLLILGLSLAGILLGIALRVRAFLYAGTIFLIFNVIGQLIHLYPEGRLEKAILLIMVGAIITGSMIWFNLQREEILQRVRIVRADLGGWE